MFALLTCLFVQVADQSASLQATNYAMSLPGGPDASTNNGAYSNVEISGVPLATLPYTIEMWVYITAKQVQYAGLVYHRLDASTNSGVQFAATWQMSNVPNTIRTNNNTSGYGLLSDTLTLNAWHHVAVVITSTNRSCYMDGKKTTENLTIPTYDFSTGRMWIGRDSANASNDNRAFKGLIDEVRIWNVEKTATELENNKYLTLSGTESGLIGYWNFDDSATVATDLSPTANHGYITGGTYVRATPTALKNAIANLSLGNDLTAITTNLTLPKTADGGVTISWTTSNAAVVDTLGNVNRPTQYDATVKLTATLSMVENGTAYTLTKVFTVVVVAFNEAAWQVAKWDFATENISLENGVIRVTEASENAYKATLMNEATIRTIGTTEQFNVLDLGNDDGYLDMDTTIGEAIYSLSNYTMCGYFRIDDDYTELSSDGNSYWVFSNTDDVATDRNGYIIGSLTTQGQIVSRIDNTLGSQTVSVGSNAATGAWHHLAYTQNGETGTIYIDGVEMATGPVTNLPSVDLAIAGRTGTRYNWLGRSPFTSNVYLRNTLLYDFQIWRDALTGDDLNFELSITETLEKLNNAYAEDSCYLLPELTSERDALTLSGLSSVTTNLTLPTQGTADQTISILWKSSLPDIISDSGVLVSRPDYYPVNVTLTATLFKNGQTTTKTFIATVPANEGTSFTNDLLIKFDFSTVNGTTVTDAAEKHFEGTLVNGADIRPIGESTVYNTLDLTDSTGYFDMGSEMGIILYNLSDYTMSCYYRVDSANASLSNAGNFLWTFSNSDKTGTDQNGALFGGLKSQSVVITPEYYSTGEQGVSAGSAAALGGWHHLAYTQKDTIGTLYVDGMSVTTDTITWVPSNTLPIEGRTGTNYNWLGRSCYVGDAYLSKTLLYDFRIYNKALTEEEIQMTELNVGTTINALDGAYTENPNIPQAIKSVANPAIKVYTTGNGIRIHGLTGTEKVTLYDITGRQIRFDNPSEITISRGLYLVRVDNFVTKVFVR